MKTTAMKTGMGLLAVSLALGAFAADPVISDVVVRQRWPWSQLVDIDYVLTCDATQSVDVAVAAQDGSTTLTLPAESLSGDLSDVAHGTHRIVWDPMKTAYTNSQMLTQFSVTLTQTPVPVYMIVDLTKDTGADGQIEYVYPGDARLETYGRFTNVWFGVTNDSTYATTKLVLRRVPAGTFVMGTTSSTLGYYSARTPLRNVTLSHGFYVGVFELTQKQWELVYGTAPSTYKVDGDTRPLDASMWQWIRGSNIGTNWPVHAQVDDTSFIGKLRARTRMDGIDLPTSAQWEYAARAGVYTNGLQNGLNITNRYEDANLSLICRYKFNGGMQIIPGATNAWGASVSTEFATARVGSFPPNNWGLYDVHGNVREWCLNRANDDNMITTEAQDAYTNPVGASAETGTYAAGRPLRALRGGSIVNDSDITCLFYQDRNVETSVINSTGLRLVVNLGPYLFEK
jgi:formylglycine-generating enzyme required for sulfatase activity